MEELLREDVGTLINWAKSSSFDEFCQKITECLPTGAIENRKQAKAIYELLKSEADRDTIMDKLETALEQRERLGMRKGMAIGGTIATAVAGLLYLVSRKND